MNDLMLYAAVIIDILFGVRLYPPVALIFAGLVLGAVLGIAKGTGSIAGAFTVVVFAAACAVVKVLWEAGVLGPVAG